MTAPALPPLPPEVQQALDEFIDRALDVGRDPMRVVEGAEAYATLVRAIDRALRGDAAHRAEVERAVREAVEQERAACARIVRAFREQSEPGDDVRLTLEQAEQDICAGGAKP